MWLTAGAATSRTGVVPFEQLDFGELSSSPSSTAPLQSRRGSRHAATMQRPQMIDYAAPEPPLFLWRRIFYVGPDTSGFTSQVAKNSSFA